MLRSTTSVQAIQVKLRKVISDLEQEWASRSAPVLSSLLCGKIGHDEAGERLSDIAEDLEDKAREELIQILDEAWDFSDNPGGMVGGLLEGMDDAAWRVVLEGLGAVAKHVCVWIRDALMVVDLDPARRADRLDARAAELESSARGALAWRAASLRRRAATKRDRASKLRQG